MIRGGTRFAIPLFRSRIHCFVYFFSPLFDVGVLYVSRKLYDRKPSKEEFEEVHKTMGSTAKKGNGETCGPSNHGMCAGKKAMVFRLGRDLAIKMRSSCNMCACFDDLRVCRKEVTLVKHLFCVVLVLFSFCFVLFACVCVSCFFVLFLGKEGREGNEGRKMMCLLIVVLF